MTTRAAAVAPPTAAPEAAAAGHARPRVLRWSVLVWLAAFGVLLANAPGRMVFDTKLVVDVDPWGYFTGLWHLWDPTNTLGALRNQAVGYAIPMAPFYLLGHLAQLPVWLIERLWMSLIIAIGFAGLVRLAGALGIGSPASRLLAGLVFALWPTFTIVIGSTSASVLPGMLAPWAVLPLVAAVRQPAARQPGKGQPGKGQPGKGQPGGAVRAAARSGAVVLCMSGVNATVTIDALLLPGLFILTYARGRHLVRLAICWAAAVAAATAWWALPLLLQGRYAFNFLPYVEQSSTTTATMSAAAMLRGAGNWVAYFNVGTPWLSAGWTMVGSPVAVIAGAIAAACGLYGLAMRNMPAAVWLRLSVGIAAAVALAGYGGPLGGPFHQAIDNLLNGPLAPFRNVYKLEPVIAAALALGLAHAAATWLATARATADASITADATARPGRSGRTRPGILVARAVIGLTLIGLALPYLSGQVLNPGSFPAVPRYWYQVASWLAANSPDNPALVVPADSHGFYAWGDPIDDPLVALATSPWAELGLVPYGGAGSQVLLATAENAVESGEQVPGLAGYLQRAGMRYVVIRNDLDPQQAGYTPAAIVHQTLALSGYTRVASFGPLIANAQTGPQPAPKQQAPPPSYPAVEVYAPAGSGPVGQSTTGQGTPSQGTLSPVTTLPVSQTVLVNGGPDSLLQLTGQHLLASGQPAIIAGDPLPVTPAGWAVTDGQRRADTLFGLTDSNVSYPYTATETNPPDSFLGAPGGQPRQLLPVPAAGHQTVAVLSGAASVTVSSYGARLADTQQEDPASAFDGNPATAWTEGSPLTPVGQWIQIDFTGQLTMPGSVGIRLLDDSPGREIASELRVSTAAGSATTALTATGAVQRLNVVPGPTRWLRITITAAARVAQAKPGAGISDVLIPGVRVTRLLQPAEDPAGKQAASVAFSFHQQVPSPATFASPAAVAPMARTFTLAGPLTLRLQASALAIPGPGLDALLDQIPPPDRGVLQVSVASTPGAQPAGFPASLITGSGGRPWVADGTSPVIHLSWHGKRRLSWLVVRPVTSGASIPRTVRITSPDGTRQASIGPGGLVALNPPLTTERIDISFPSVQQNDVISLTGQQITLPVALWQLSVPALANLRPVTPDQQAPFTLACGQGPALSIDGSVYRTSVSGTLGELSQFLPLQVRLCNPGGTLTLGAGRHTLTAAPGTFAVTDLSLATAAASATASPASAGPASASPASASPASASPALTAPRAVTITSWQPDNRLLRIGPGVASYLEVHQNYNAGWTAVLNGHPLTPVRLDGWQQGFIVPAGSGGAVMLTFRPAASYHVALIATIIAVAILLAVAAWSFARRRPAPEPASDQAPASDPVPADDPVPASDQAFPNTRRPRRTWPGVLAVTALIFLAGGPVALAVPALAWLAWLLQRSRTPSAPRDRSTSPPPDRFTSPPRDRFTAALRGRFAAAPLPVLAAAGLIVSGLLSAAQPFGDGLLGPFGWPAQVCALIALAAALMPTAWPAPAEPDPEPVAPAGQAAR